MIKLSAILFAISMADPQAEPKPIARYVAAENFETIEICKAAVPETMTKAVKEVNEKIRPMGIMVVKASITCAPDEDEPKGQKI